jgi:hypothetical protein
MQVTDFLLLRNDHLWWGFIDETRLLDPGNRNFVGSVWEQRVRLMLPVEHRVTVLHREPGLMHTEAIATDTSPLKLNYQAEYRIEPEADGYRFTLTGQIRLPIPLARLIFQPFISVISRRYLKRLQNIFYSGDYLEVLQDEESYRLRAAGNVF